MRLRPGNRFNSRRDPTDPFGYARRSGPPARQDQQEDLGRHELQALSERQVPVDPYQAWVEQRDRERELECANRPQIRWVHRPPGTSGPAAQRIRLTGAAASGAAAAGRAGEQ